MKLNVQSDANLKYIGSLPLLKGGKNGDSGIYR